MINKKQPRQIAMMLSGNFQIAVELNPHGFFPQKRYDYSTQHTHFINREYDANTGRWLTPDPLGFEDGCNLYAYVHNNPLIYIDPYGLWRESLNYCSDLALEFGNSLSRGYIDDASYGVSSRVLGEHETPTINSKMGYYTGTGCSLATGIFTGGTLLKGGVYSLKAVKYGFKALKNVFQSTKPLVESVKVVRSAVSHTSATKVFQKTHQMGSHAVQETVVTSKKIWSSTKNRTSVKNAFSHWNDHKNEFPELINAKQYVERARSLFSESEKVLTKFRSNGEILRYQPESNIFGAFTKEGIPKSLFRPDAGSYYWNTRN